MDGRSGGEESNVDRSQMRLGIVVHEALSPKQKMGREGFKSEVMVAPPISEQQSKRME